MYKQANLSFSVTAQAYGDDVNAIQFSTQDKNSAKLVFSIKEGKAPLNLADVDGIVDLVMGDKSVFEGNKAEVTGPLEGKLEYTITPEQIRHPGKTRGELKLVSKSGQVIGGFRFTFTIKKALLDEFTGPIKEFYIEDLEAVKKEVKEKADAIVLDIDKFKGDIDSRTTVIEEQLNSLDDDVAQSTVLQVDAAKKDTTGQTHSDLDSRIKAEVGKITTKQTEFTTLLGQKVNKSYADLRGQYSDILTPVGYTRFIGHRGPSSVVPEGTLAAIAMASEVGMWSCEGDTQLTADGEWIIFHDPIVDGKTDGTGNVKDMTLAQIKALTIDSGNNIAYYPNLKIPTLKEYLLACREHNIVPCIEIKSDTFEPPYKPEDYDKFVRIIRECGVESKIIVQGSEPLCTQIRQRSKLIVLMVFTNFSSLTTWAGNYIKEIGNAMLNTDNSYVTSQADVELAHSMGIPVSVFVVDDVNRALELSKWGVDFIMTNTLTGSELS